MDIVRLRIPYCFVRDRTRMSWRDVRFGERFVDIYTQSGRGQLTVDYGRLHDTEAAE